MLNNSKNKAWEHFLISSAGVTAFAKGLDNYRNLCWAKAVWYERKMQISGFLSGDSCLHLHLSTGRVTLPLTAAK